MPPPFQARCFWSAMIVQLVFECSGRRGVINTKWINNNRSVQTRLRMYNFAFVPSTTLASVPPSHLLLCSCSCFSAPAPASLLLLLCFFFYLQGKWMRRIISCVDDRDRVRTFAQRNTPTSQVHASSSTAIITTRFCTGLSILVQAPPL